jgi:uncharacterized membrane protein YphA (DoxX/SURF4 family)
MSNIAFRTTSPAFRGKLILYWITTGLIALETGLGAEWDIARIPFVRHVFDQLGYPLYVLTIMGVWKAFGVIVLLAPRLARPKEWVYAGLFFIYTGAVASHLSTNDDANAWSPAILAALTIVSWALRPPSRREFAPWRVTALSRKRLILYWVATALVVFQLGAGGVGDILQPQGLVEGMTHLGYPVYFCTILGVWKVLGAVTLLIPGFARLKEWAYAGAFFDLTGAAASHLTVGDSAVKLIAPLLFAGLVIASWALRPPARRDPE